MTLMSAYLILTRPKDQAEAFVRDFGDNWPSSLEVMISPLLRISPNSNCEDIGGYRGLIFTSSNAVALIAEGDGRPAFCVGRATTSIARARGWDAVFCGDTAQELARTLMSDRVQGPLLHASGKHIRCDIAGVLTRAGIDTNRCVLYDQEICALSHEARFALSSRADVLVPLFSPRTADAFVQEAPFTARLHLICISDAVRARCTGLEVTSSAVVLSPNAQSIANEIGNCALRLEAQAGEH